MATYLFNDISEFKNYVGGGANVSLELSSIGPTMYMAAQEHLLPWLGATTWADLVDAVANDDATPDEAALLPYVQRPLALLTMYEYSQIGSLQFGEAGMYRMESDESGMKSPYKYQENAYREYMKQKGFEALELMLLFLDANDDTYTDWAAGDGFARTRGLLINYARDFREVYSKKVTRYTFEVLRPLVEDVERFALIYFLGAGQYNRLKAGILADDLTADELTLVKHLRRAVAPWVIEEGIRRHWVTFKGDQVIQLDAPENNPRENLPGENAVSLKLRADEELANRHLSYVKQYLADNLATYPLYSAYLDELAAAAEAAATAEDLCNDPDYRAFPGHCCNRYPHCSCSTTSRTGLVRL